MKDTRQRILDAATRVFARAGVSGATTKEIARVARVNEVTLFRYFKNKSELLHEVVTQNCRHYEHVFAEASFETEADFRRTVQAFVESYARLLRANEEFIRTFFGELNRQPKLCRRLFVESVKPARQKFIDYLRSAQKKRLIRKNLDATTAADALTGMLLAGMIRRPLTESVYTNERYVETCLELFLRGIKP